VIRGSDQALPAELVAHRKLAKLGLSILAPTVLASGLLPPLPRSSIRGCWPKGCGPLRFLPARPRPRRGGDRAVHRAPARCRPRWIAVHGDRRSAHAGPGRHEDGTKTWRTLRSAEIEEARSSAGAPKSRTTGGSSSTRSSRCTSTGAEDGASVENLIRAGHGHLPLTRVVEGCGGCQRLDCDGDLWRALREDVLSCCCDWPTSAYPTRSLCCGCCR
jgi:hypothetical protein